MFTISVLLNFNDYYIESAFLESLLKMKFQWVSRTLTAFNGNFPSRVRDEAYGSLIRQYPLDHPISGMKLKNSMEHYFKWSNGFGGGNALHSFNSQNVLQKQDILMKMFK